VGLESIRGHEEAVALLRRAIETDRVAHAYAFIGPEGVGRKVTALAFAEALVGAAGAGRIARGAHPDVRVIEPTPPESNPKGTLAIRVENIRELGRRASLRPAEAPWKVFIVDQAETMTGAAPQAFLKTLEEPPARTVIILILSQLRALPATVLSRCQIVRFRPIVPEGAVALLPRGDGPEREQALQWLAQVQSRGAGAVLQIGEAIGRDREAAESMVETCWLWYRDLLCAQVSEIEKPDGSRRTLDEVVAGLRACREAWQAIQGNVSPRLSVEVLLSRLTEVRAAGRRGAGAPPSEASEIHRQGGMKT
jgi:DNA polymerase-3 subunit delta'